MRCLNRKYAGFLALMLLSGCHKKDDVAGPCADCGSHSGIDTLVADAGAYPDPVPPKPGLFEVESTDDVSWPYGEEWTCRTIRVGLDSHPVSYTHLTLPTSDLV